MGGMGSSSQCQPDEPYVSFPPVRQPKECPADKGPSGGSAGDRQDNFNYEPIAVPINNNQPPKAPPVVPEIELIRPTAEYDTLEPEESFESEESSESSDSSDDDWDDDWGDDSDDD